MQEVFIKVFRAKPPAEETFLGWFYTVILNTGRDLGRRRKTRKGLLERLTEAAPAEPAAADAGDPPRTATPACAPPSPRWLPTCARWWRCASSPTSRWSRSRAARTCPWVQSSRGCTAPWRACARPSPRKRSTVAENDDTRMNEQPAGGAGGSPGGARGGPGGARRLRRRPAARLRPGSCRRPGAALRRRPATPSSAAASTPCAPTCGAVSDGVNAAVPAPDDSYADLSQERWRGLAPYLRPAASRQARRPRAFFHRALAPAAALLLVAAVLGGVFALSHHGKSMSATGTLAAKSTSHGAGSGARSADRRHPRRFRSPQDTWQMPTTRSSWPAPARSAASSSASPCCARSRARRRRALRLRSQGSTLPPHTLTILYWDGVGSTGPREAWTRFPEGRALPGTWACLALHERSTAAPGSLPPRRSPPAAPGPASSDPHAAARRRQGAGVLVSCHDRLCLPPQRGARRAHASGHQGKHIRLP